jgi:hypothetical protein
VGPSKVLRAVLGARRGDPVKGPPSATNRTQSPECLVGSVGGFRDGFPPGNRRDSTKSPYCQAPARCYTQCSGPIRQCPRHYQDSESAKKLQPGWGKSMTDSPPATDGTQESVLFGPGQVSNTRPGPFWLVNTHCQGLRICQETETEGIPSTL